VVGLAVAQASLVGLAGVWVGGAAVLSEGRVLLLAIPVLFLSASLRVGRRPWLAAGVVVAVVALAGLPPTAGFAGRVALYDRWLAEGQVALVLVMALLHAPLIAVAARLLWNWLSAGEVVDSAGQSSMEGWRPLLAGVALLLAALGLLTVSGVAWGEVRLVSWLAVLLPVAAGVWLARWKAERWMGNVTITRRPLALIARLADGLRQLISGASATLREAAHILEGEGGLLWLLLLVVVFWLARRG
jgi:NADH:ubiquinone oxidoreductase subunit 2 (subunit N)